MSDSIFDDLERSDRRPKNYSESEYSYINRSGRPPLSRVRELLESWYSHYPKKHIKDLKARFTSSDDTQHKGAFFELYLHNLLLHFGLHVTIHPKLEGKSTHPDFLASSKKNIPLFILEATIATKPHDEFAAEKRINIVYDSIDRLDSPNFFLGVRIQGKPDTPPPGKKWKIMLAHWLLTLNPDAVLKKKEHFPEKTLTHDGWIVTFEAIPKGSRSRGKPGIRPIAAHMFDFKKLNIAEQIRNSIEAKVSKYGEISFPYLLAVNVHDLFFREEMAWDVLFGDEYLLISSIRSETELQRAQNGIFNKPKGHRNCGTSAVIFFNNLSCFGISKIIPILYHNPWATNPFDATLWPFLQFKSNEEKNFMKKEAGIDVSEYFGLSSSWPIIQDEEDIDFGISE